MPKQKKAEQLDNMPSNDVRDAMLEAYELNCEFKESHEELKEKLDNCRKILRDLGKKSLTCEAKDGTQFTVRLVSVGEKVVMSIPKRKVKEELAV